MLIYFVFSIVCRNLKIHIVFSTPEPKRRKMEESSPSKGAIVLKEFPEAAARSRGAVTVGDRGGFTNQFMPRVRG